MLTFHNFTNIIFDIINFDIELLKNKFNPDSVIYLSDRVGPQISNIIKKICFSKGIPVITIQKDLIQKRRRISQKGVSLFITDLLPPDNEKVDKEYVCFIQNASDSDKFIICGRCNRNYIIQSDPDIPLQCSQECALKDSPKLLKFLENELGEEVIKVTKRTDSNCKKAFDDKSMELPIGKTKNNPKEEKFLRIMMLEAKRREYQMKKEQYKRDMKANRSNKKIIDEELGIEKLSKTIKPRPLCKAKTKKETKQCKNKSLENSEYCGIPSHRKLCPNSNTKNYALKKRREAIRKKLNRRR